MNEVAEHMPVLPGTVHNDEIFTGLVWQPLRGRNMDHAIQTVSGRFFWPLEAYVDEIFLEDIVHGLARECRFSNHLSMHYSVAWHCVAMSEVVPDYLKKWALIHDTTEAYLRDLPRPLKRHPLFKEYPILEDKFMIVLAEFFGMPETAIPEELKEYDTDMGNCELRVLYGTLGEAKLRSRGYSEEYINGATGALKWKDWVRTYSAEEAKQIWLARYEELFVNDNSANYY